MSATIDRLTTREYWSSYYSHNNADRDEIEHICGEYDDVWNILVNSCKKKPETIIEIGAYPGRFLSYLASRYQLYPTALDFNPDLAAIEKSMAAMNVKNFRCINKDFLAFRPLKRYDLVVSIGFIEHFVNFDEVLDLHCNYVDENGAMLIMIPHMRYGQYLHRKIFDQENLDIHNLECMKTSVFEKFAERNDLQIRHLSYFGGFLTNVHKPLHGVKDLCNRVERKAFKLINPVLSKHPSRFYSSTLIGIFTR